MVYVYISEYACLCRRVRRPEADTRCLPLLLTVLFFGTGSLTESVSCWFWLDCPGSSQDLPVSTWGYRHILPHWVPHQKPVLGI